MSETETTETETDAGGEHATRRTDDRRDCRRCGRPQGLVGKYDIFLCRQCFREVARDMGFSKYR